MLFGFAPFAVLYAIPFVFDAPMSPYLNYAVVTLPLIPLTIAYAIVRYRLMDVDVIFRRGYAYTLATLCVLAAFYAIVFALGSLVQKNFKDLGNAGLITVMLIATFLFQPIRNWIQEKLDRYFYRDRYDYRRTLIEFARELNSETDLGPDAAIGGRPADADAVDPACGFLSRDAKRHRRPPADGQLAPADVDGFERATAAAAGDLDLSFLNWPQHTPYLFFERTRYRSGCGGEQAGRRRCGRPSPIWI